MIEQHIRSFVRRSGRIGSGQARHLKETLPKIEIPFSDAPVDLNLAFGRDNPKIMEIGFGMGEATAQMALESPDTDFWCLDVHLAGAGALSKKVAENNLSNIRITVFDAVEVLKKMVLPETLNGANIFFPDPWHKKRHHKRRLIQAPFVELLVSRLKNGAILRTATDWEEYALAMLAVFQKNPNLQNRYQDFAARENRPLSKFEQRGLNRQHGIWDLIFTRI